MTLLDLILWTPIVLAAIFFGTWYGFKLAIRAKRKLEDPDTRWTWWLLAAPLAIVFIILDAIFNQIWGRILYEDGPQGMLFTDTTQWYIDNARYAPPCDDFETAYRWAKRLNRVDPEHINLDLEKVAEYALWKWMNEKGL